ncbi:hypothetical protein [Plantactinospora sp. B24E8]|uniref:hypothetical protein n=1 Tax=Plantactinospora sp. B24E8 TaxID=3153567 RepID=UPI00325EA6E8
MSSPWPTSTPAPSPRSTSYPGWWNRRAGHTTPRAGICRSPRCCASRPPTSAAGSWTDVRQPGPPDGPLILLPPRWRPDLCPTDRKLLEAEAIAAHSNDAWLLYLGRTASRPPDDPAVELARRCRLADLLCLDLVVEARRQRGGSLSWHLGYELPGSPVPTDPRGHADNLTTAIISISELDTIYGLEESGRTVPAYRLNCPDLPPAGPTMVDLDQLERRILADCVGVRSGEPTAGAQAIWRDGRWWHTSLREADTTTCEIVLREPDGVRPLVTAATLPAAIGALGLTPGG